MSLVQQFLQQNVGTIQNHAIFKRITNCQRGVQDLLYTLQNLHNLPKLVMIDQKIVKITNLLKFKQEVICIIQNGDDEILWNWISQILNQQPLLTQIIVKQWIQVKKILHEIIRSVFLPEKSMQKFHKKNQIIKNYLFCLQQIRKIIEDNKIPSRNYLKNIDQWSNLVYQQINYSMIEQFNKKVYLLFKKLFRFQDHIKNQFELFFKQEIAGDTYQKKEINSQMNQNHSQIQFRNSSSHPNVNSLYSNTKSKIKSINQSFKDQIFIDQKGSQINSKSLHSNIYAPFSKSILGQHNREKSNKFR